MSTVFSDEKELMASIKYSIDLVKVCEDFVKSSENSVERYKNCVKQYPSNPNYKSCLEEAEDWLVESKEALKQAKIILNERLEIYKIYYGEKETLH